MKIHTHTHLVVNEADCCIISFGQHNFC